VEDVELAFGRAMVEAFAGLAVRASRASTRSQRRGHIWRIAFHLIDAL